MYCPVCGHELRYDAAFCTLCGSRLKPSARGYTDDSVAATQVLRREDVRNVNATQAMSVVPPRPAPEPMPVSQGAVADASSPAPAKHKGYRPGRGSLIIAVVGLIVIGVVARTVSLLYASNHPITYLTVSRVSGFVIYALLTVSVAQGIFLSLRWRMGTPLRYWMERLHPWLLITAGLVLTVHIGMLLRVDFPVLQALVPYTSSFKRQSVGAGIISMYIGAVLTLTTYRMRWIGGYRVWRIIHYLGFIAWIQALIHGFMTGSDSHKPGALALYVFGAVLVGVLIIIRIARQIYVSRRQAAVASPA